MLSTKPSMRPSIIDIINKPFIKKKVIEYLEKSLTARPELGRDEVDDVNYIYIYIYIRYLLMVFGIKQSS